MGQFGRSRNGAGGSIAPAEETAGAADELKLEHLAEPVKPLAGLDRDALPDALDAALYRIEHKENPSGIELFAARLFRELNLASFRTVAVKTGATLARINHSRMFYINFDRDKASTHDVDLLFTVEAVLNRISYVLDRLGCGLGPAKTSVSEAGCSLLDQDAFSCMTGWVGSVYSHMSDKNPLACPGNIMCKPGGEWDVRTRFALLMERLNLVTRLDYTYACDTSEGWLSVCFAKTRPKTMPASRYDALAKSWHVLNNSEREALAREHDARVALVLATAGFAAGANISQVRVVVDVPGPEAADIEGLYIPNNERSRVYAFDRAEFIAHYLPESERLYEVPYEDFPCRLLLMPALRPELSADAVMAQPREFALPPAEDPRELPDSLKCLLLADWARELEVMEGNDDPYTKRFEQIREETKYSTSARIEALTGFVAELEAGCALEELASDVPVQSQFCDNYLGRIVMPVIAHDPNMRILHAPDALYFAQLDLVHLYQDAGDVERALSEARKLVDLGASSVQSHFVLINVLARLERFDEIVEVCKHAMRVAWTNDSAAYIYYRMGFAYWQLGKLDTALACYRMVAGDVEISRAAELERKELMNEMGIFEMPSVSAAQSVLEQAGAPVAFVDELLNQIEDAAILLVENGFFFLARRCVHAMWRIEGGDEMGALNRSLR